MIEQIKTVVIAVLITGIVAFICGTSYGTKQAHAQAPAPQSLHQSK